MITLKVNDTIYPVNVQPLRWMHGYDWVEHPAIQIPDEVSDQLDQYYQELPGFIRETIQFSLIDGWSSSGTIFEDDTEYPPVRWAILVNGDPVGRDELQDVLEGVC